jgi:hypothetical protein
MTDSPATSRLIVPDPIEELPELENEDIESLLKRWFGRPDA